LHKELSTDDILAYRCMVHNRLQPSGGVARARYMSAVAQLTHDLLMEGSRGGGGSGKGKNESFSQRSRRLGASDEAIPKFQFTVNLSISRLALALTYMKVQTADRRAGVSFPVLNVCLYSLGLSTKWSALAELSASLRVGSILGFGYRGAQILCVGREGGEWQNFRWHRRDADKANSPEDEGPSFEDEVVRRKRVAAVVLDVSCSEPDRYDGTTTALNIYNGGFGRQVKMEGGVGVSKIEVGEVMVSILKRIHALLVAPAFDRFLSRWTHGLYHHFDSASKRLHKLRQLTAARSVSRAFGSASYVGLSVHIKVEECIITLSTPRREHTEPEASGAPNMWREAVAPAPGSAPTTAANSPMNPNVASTPLTGMSKASVQAPFVPPSTNTRPESAREELQERVRIKVGRCIIVRGTQASSSGAEVDTSPERLAALGEMPLKEAYAHVDDIIDVSMEDDVRCAAQGFRVSVEDVEVDLSTSASSSAGENDNFNRTDTDGSWRPLLLAPVSLRALFIRMGAALKSPFIGINADIFVSPVLMELDPSALSSVLLLTASMYPICL